MAKKERTLPDDLSIDFVICDNTVNRYGWRLLVEGIDLTNFNKNPVACKQHNMWEAPIGKWSDLRVDNSRLIGKLHFDPSDDDSVELYWKYKDGFMSAVSLSIAPTETSTDPSVMIPGQKYETVTKSELLEISTVTVPGQGNAVKLCYPNGSEYKLSLIENNSAMSGQKTVEQLTQDLQAANAANETLKKLCADQLIALHAQRGVVSEAENPSLLKLALMDFESVKLMLEAKVPAPATAQPSDTTSRETMADTLVKLHFERGAITAAQRDFYRNAAVLNYEGTATLLQSLPGSAQLQQTVLGLGGGQKSAPATDDRKDWKYLDWWKKDQAGLEAMRLNAPEKYAALEAECLAEGEKQGIISKSV